ncbi:hypothetical protein ACLKMH_13670 [Psychromonas sp. KJ10-10]|uniref:hypothetical protein n=1 Tax=Psychromonas sp. KJ10-10 TaxID=3391823 RepID=UPI0039B4A679
MLSKHQLADFPFTGGVLGSINYELGYQFEQITNAENPEALTLPELSLGFYDWALLYKHHCNEFSLIICQTQYDDRSPETVLATKV